MGDATRGYGEGCISYWKHLPVTWYSNVQFKAAGRCLCHANDCDRIFSISKEEMVVTFGLGEALKLPSSSAREQAARMNSA